MRKHSVRKWIHAILDLLPLFTIPIFALAVRSDNNFTPISVTVGEDITETLHFNQNVVDGLPSSLNYWDSADYSLTLNNGYVVLNNLLADEGDSVSTSLNDFDLFSNHIYLISYQIANDGFYCDYDVVVYDVNDNEYYINSDNPVDVNSIDTTHVSFSPSSDLDDCKLIFYLSNNEGTQNFYFRFVMLFDLTFMYGSGNEPTIEDFITDYPNDYYDYTLDTPIVNVIGQNSVTYNDTDVGSQMVYTLYNTVDKYFNFNHIGVFGDLYDWFSVNFLGGNVPMSYFIVWNVILYEFVMDILFLTYMVFMFIIDFTEHLIDSFFDKCYRGGR